MRSQSALCRTAGLIEAGRRLKRLTFVLTPGVGVPPMDIERAAKMACSVACQQDLQPFHSWLHYGMFLPPDELQGERYNRLVSWWLRRAGRLWLCFPDPAKTALDAFAYQILMANEMCGYVRRPNGDPHRLQVHQITWTQNDAPRVELLDRDTLRELLQCNVVDGLLKGGLQ
jgi:hypothetical protein